MRKIIVTEFITLDGVVEAPGGNETDHIHGGWNFKYDHPETSKYKIDELAGVDALLLGRTTYDQFAAYWPGQKGGGFADKINQMPKYIVSETLQEVNWNNSQLIRNFATGIAELKKSAGGDILVYGSATLVKALLQHKFVDELRLMVHPLSIGGGLKLFDEARGLSTFTLKHAQIVENGVLILEYLPS